MLPVKVGDENPPRQGRALQFIASARRKVYRSREQAMSDVFDYIERFHNPTPSLPARDQSNNTQAAQEKHV